MNVERLHKNVEALYDEYNKELLFHGWHHIWFVAEHAARFADLVQADIDLVRSAALVHDLNYIVERDSEPVVAKNFRAEVLIESGYSQEDVDCIENIIDEAHTGHRTEKVSLEGMALSDADTLFKALPITPILFAGKYIQETGTDIEKLAHKVVSEQAPLLETDIYFYIKEVHDEYISWAKTNLDLWSHVESCLQDPITKKMLELADMRTILKK